MIGKVVKIASWLLKSYDFMSQHVYNVSNQVKTRNRSNSIKIDQTLLKSVKSDRFYEFGRVWSISSFNPQKLKNLLSPCPSPLTLHYIVPTPQSPLSPLPKSQIFNLTRLTPALKDLGYGKALYYYILGREGMIEGSKPWEDRGRWWGIKGVK